MRSGKQALFSEWPEIRAQAAAENTRNMDDFLPAVERAARHEQEEIKLRIRPQLEKYRQLVGLAARRPLTT